MWFFSSRQHQFSGVAGKANHIHIILSKIIYSIVPWYTLRLSPWSSSMRSVLFGLTPAIYIIKSHNIILTKIFAALHLDHYQIS